MANEKDLSRDEIHFRVKKESAEKGNANERTAVNVIVIHSTKNLCHPSLLQTLL